MKRIMPGLLLLLSSLFIACDQEPLFWIIAHEYPPIEPLIEGSPSRIAEVTYPNSDPDLVRTVLYVTNGEIWEWNVSASPHPNWSNIGSPGGKIKTVAATDGHLFSLDWDGNIRKFDGSVWSSVGGISGKPEQIFGAGACLFAGSRTGTAGAKDGYCILAMNSTDTTMKSIRSGTGLLMGAAEQGGAYYLGTRGDGILLTTSPTSDLAGSAVSGTVDAIFSGLIKHGDQIVGVTRNQVMYLNGGIFVELASYSSTEFSGAMASWENSDGDRLLLLGLQRSSGSFGYGYRELIWKAGESLNTNQNLYPPGEGGVSSVEQDLQYISAIGNHVVNALYVVPFDSSANKADDKGRPIVLASTQKNGLWSYRTRSGRAQWNGEDNSY